jgi:hypothetical protein
VVTRRLAIPESLRSDDIADAVSSKKHSTGELLLRRASNIARNHRQTHRKPKTLKVAQPKRNEAAPFVAVRQAHKESGSTDADRVRHHHGNAAQIRESGAYKAASDQGEELHSSTWDLEVLGAKGVKAEGAYNDGRELD